MAKTWEELKAMSDEQLIKEHDQVAKHVQVATRYYLDELRHRQYERHTKAMLNYTRQMKWMTLMITAFTIANILLACYK